MYWLSMQGPEKMIRDFKRWPYQYNKYLNAFRKMLEVRLKAGLPTDWADEYEVMAWWLEISVREVMKINEQ